MEYQTPGRYLEDSCEQCGTCLMLCPVLHLTPRQARREIANLREGRPSTVLRLCQTCFDCDFFCPKGCNPGRLILNRWNRVVEEKGLLERACYFLPHSRPNFRTYVIDRMTPFEKSLLRSWDDLSPAREICYPGCNIITTPLLTQTRALEGLDIRGALDYCCGEMYYRMGLFETVRQVARKTQSFFDAIGAEKVTILCTAGYYMFTEVLPRFGADYRFEMESYLSVLKRRLDSGEIRFEHPLDMRITVQDSCYGKQFGPEYLDLPREILTMAGARIKEMGHSRDCMLCCGIGAGFSPYSAFNPARMARSAVRLLRSAKKTGADAIATYCSGCLQMFSTGLIAYRTGPPVYHLLELVGIALGETPARLTGRASMDLLIGTLRHQTPVLFSRRRFHPPSIDTGTEPSTHESG